MSHFELDYLQYSKKKSNFINISKIFSWYYNTFLEQRRCPSQHSGTKMKSAAGARESWGRGGFNSFFYSICLFDSTRLILPNLSSASFTWAVWQELRLPVDTDLHINLLLPPLTPLHYAPPDVFHFYLARSQHTSEIMTLDLWWWATFLTVHCKILRISLAFSVFQPWPCRGPSQASTYLLRICVPMSRNWRRSSVRSMESALQSSYLTAQKHISPIYIIVSR